MTSSPISAPNSRRKSTGMTIRPPAAILVDTSLIGTSPVTCHFPPILPVPTDIARECPQSRLASTRKVRSCAPDRFSDLTSGGFEHEMRLVERFATLHAGWHRLRTPHAFGYF